MSNFSHVPWAEDDWTALRRFDTIHPQLGHRRRQDTGYRQQEQVRRMVPLKRGDFCGDTPSHASSSSNSSSVYANPSSPVLRPGLYSGEPNPPLRDIPYFSLNHCTDDSSRPGLGSVNMPAAERLGGTVSAPCRKRYRTADPPTTPPPTFMAAEHLYQQNLPALRHSSFEPLPKVLRAGDPDRVAPGYDQGLRGTALITSTNPELKEWTKSDDRNDEAVHGRAESTSTFNVAHAAPKDKRKRAADGEDLTRFVLHEQEKTLYSDKSGRIVEKTWCSKHHCHDWCIHLADRREHIATSRPVLVRPPTAHSMPSFENSTWTPAENENFQGSKDTSRSSCVRPSRFVDFVEHQRAMRASDAWRQYQEREQHLEAERLQKHDDEKSKQQQQQQRESMQEPPSTGGKRAPLSETQGIVPKEDRTEASAACTVDNATAVPDSAGSSRPQVEVSPGPRIHHLQSANTVGGATSRAPGLECTTSSGSIGPSTDKEKKKTTARTERGPTAARSARQDHKKLTVLDKAVAEAKAEGAWDSIDLSSDDDWEEVRSDAGGEWEVIEKKTKET